MQDSIQKYMDQCKDYEDSKDKYSHYIHGYLLPWLNEQRKAGKLTKGKTTYPSSFIHLVTNMKWTNREGHEFIYTGEVDQDGFICGEGVAFDQKVKQFKYEFTCLNGEQHGICK